MKIDLTADEVLIIMQGLAEMVDRKTKIFIANEFDANSDFKEHYEKMIKYCKNIQGKISEGLRKN